MTGKKNIQFNKLFYKVATNQFSLEYLDEVESFYLEYSGKEDFDQIKFECEHLISAMYFMNTMSEKSLEIDLHLLKENPPEDVRYSTVLQRAAKTSAELERTDDVCAYVVRFLKDPEDDWSRKLPLLAWYIEFYPNGKEEGVFDSFELTLANIIKSLGMKINRTLPFSDRVKFIYDEFLRGNKDLHAFQSAYGKAMKEEKDKILKEYLETETITFFKTQCLNTIKRSENT